MKKIFSILLASLLIVSLCVPTFAAGTLTAEVAFDTTAGGVVVSGIATGSRANFMLTMEIKDPEGEIVYVDNITVGYDNYNDAKTQLSYEFPAAVLHPKYASGTYTVLVSGDKVGKATPVTYEFKGADIQFSALAEVQSAIEAESESALTEALGLGEGGAERSADFGIDRDAYLNLGKEGKEVFFDVMLNATYEVPEDVESDENIEEVSDSVTNLRANYVKAISIGEFNDIATDDSAEKWIDKYGAEFSVDDEETDVDESKLYSYVTDALTENGNLSARLMDAGKIDNIDDIKIAFYENALLTILECRHYSESKKVFEDFGEIFGIDTSDFSKLDPDEQGEVYADACIDHDTVEDAGEYFNDLVDAILGKSSKPSSSGSSGGGSRGGNSGFTVPTQSAVKEDVQEVQSVFPDVPESMWAYEAVTALKDAGIVSGDENGRFNPENNVTRAEYIKLVVMALELDLSGGSSDFSDVSADAWFKPYIDAAFVNGLITGDDNNCANPDDFITREDMSVILYRAYDFGEQLTAEITFADSENISQYAKVAVDVLSEKGIVNGIGNNTFAPKNNATRAQAAQIIFNVLNNAK